MRRKQQGPLAGPVAAWRRRVQTVERVERRSERLAIEAGSEGSGSASYLEYSEKVVDREVVSSEVSYQVVGCACRSRFCRDCGKARGYALRKKILARGACRRWKSCQMWTLTIDPTLFDSAEAAYKWCRKRRSISELVRALRKRGVLNCKHYFCAVEWHSSGMIHFHLLLDADFIDHKLVSQLWNRNRPKDAGPIKHAKSCECVLCGGAKKEATLRPGFGAVKFSVRAFRGGVQHAVNYATKYLVKLPDEGWPDWIMDARYNVPRYQISRDFWDGEKQKKVTAETEQAETKEDEREGWCTEHGCSTVYCKCDGEGVEYEDERPTIRERVASCRAQCVVMRFEETIYDDGEVVKQRTFIGGCRESFADTCRALGVFQRVFMVAIDRDQVHQLVGTFKDETSTETGGSVCSRDGPGTPGAEREE